MKIILFDSSFVQYAYEQWKNHVDDIMDRDFPLTEHQRCIHDYVIGEFFDFTKDPENKKEQQSSLEFYEKCKFNVIASSHFIIKSEFYIISTANLCISQYKNDEVLYNLKKDIFHYKDSHQKRIEAKKEEWIKSSTPNEKIKNKKPSLKSTIDYLEERIKNEWVLPLIPEHNYSLEIDIKNNQFNLKEHGKTIKTKYIENIDDLKKNLPSLYLFLIARLFHNNINISQSNKTAKPLTSKFKLDFAGIKEHIEFNQNTVPDFQISLSGLPYCDHFVTCDKSQTKLIMLLFPDYIVKLKYFDKEKSRYVEDLKQEMAC